MDKLIQLLSVQTGYTPNETDLKVTTLTTLLADMRTKNTGSINALTPLSNARIARNTILSATGTGLVDIAGEVKKYVKSVFGGTSPQYKQVSGLSFLSRVFKILQRLKNNYSTQFNYRYQLHLWLDAHNFRLSFRQF